MFAGTEENAIPKLVVVEETFTEADHRISAKFIGSTAIVLLVLTVCAILLLDGSTLHRHLHFMRANIRSRFMAGDRRDDRNED